MTKKVHLCHMYGTIWRQPLRGSHLEVAIWRAPSRGSHLENAMNKKLNAAKSVFIVAIPETAGSALYGMVDVLNATGNI